MNCSLSSFMGFYGTIPVYEATGLCPQQVLSLTAGDILIREEKSQVPYTTPIIFEEGPYIGQTAEKMRAHGRTVGVQRSARHAQNCQAAHLMFDFDGLIQCDRDYVLSVSECFKSFAYSSHSYGRPEKGECFRVIVFLDSLVTGLADYAAVWRGIEQTYFPGLADPSSSRPYQMQGGWATSADRKAAAWRITNLSQPILLSTDKLLKVGRKAIERSPFGRSGIIASAGITCMPQSGLDPALALPPVLLTDEQLEIFDALCMLDSSQTELMIKVFGCLRAMGDEYQGHLETWVACNPTAVEKYRRKHPTKYDPRHMWTQTNWRPTISAEAGKATLKTLARASAWYLLNNSEEGLLREVAATYLERYHPVWCLQQLESAIAGDQA